MAMVQTLLGHELRNVQLVFLEDEARVDFEELVYKLGGAAGVNSLEVDVEGVVNKVFLGDN